MKWGDPLKPDQRGKHSETRSPQDRLAERTMKGEPGDCWEWTGAVRANGYGAFWLNGENLSA
ncbi:MAG: hypothetical protein ACPGWS_09705, partial [Solirubrobacterales bacterium]